MAREFNFKFKMPDDESLAKYISIKGEKGERGDPTKLSQLENDTGFIGKSTTELENYYTKTETDNRISTAVNELDEELGVPDGFFTDTNETVSGEGTTITLNDTANAVFKDIKLYGDAEQDGTPTPSIPIDVEVVTGDQTIVITDDDQQSQSYTISLGDLELCKIGEHRDYIYRDGSDWKLHKAIGTIVFDSSTAWSKHSSTGGNIFMLNNTGFVGYAYNTGRVAPALMDTDLVAALGSGGGVSDNAYGRFGITNAGQLRVFRGDYDSGYSASLFKSEMEGHYLIGVLTAPTDTIITDTTLIAQLNALSNAQSYNGSTILSISGNKSAILSVLAFNNNWVGTISGINNELGNLTEHDNATDSALNTIDQKVSKLPFADTSKVVLYTFFDDSVSTGGTIGFYLSEDGINLTKLETANTISGRDPSLFFRNGKYYLAVTNYSSTFNFTVYVSEDLNNWTQHDIDVGLYDATYPKVWAAEWFEDDDDKLYVVISKQYANTEGWGDFHSYIIECTDLESLTFSTPQQMILEGASADNHIDGAIAKCGDTYHLIIKSDHQTELYQEHYTSSDLINWTLESVDPMRFGRGVEGAFVYEKDGEYFIGAERYAIKPLVNSYYAITKTTDFVNFSSVADLTYADNDISHGNGLVIEATEINKLLNTGLVCLTEHSKELANIPADKKFDIVATRFTATASQSGTRLGDYLHLFDVKCLRSYRSQSIIFHINTSLSVQVDATYKLAFNSGNNTISDVAFTESDCLTKDIDTPMSVAGSLFAIRDADDAMLLRVYLETDRITSTDQKINIDFMSSVLDCAKITTYTDDFTNTAPSGYKSYARGSAKSQSVTFNNGTNPYIRVVCGCYNGCIQLTGHENSVSDVGRLVNSLITLNNGYAGIHHLNPDYDGSITVAVESYTSTNNDRKREYSLLLSNVRNASAITMTLPNNMYSYIKKVEYLNSID